MEFLTQLLIATVRYVLIIAVAVGGVFLGKFLRTKKDGKC